MTAAETMATAKSASDRRDHTVADAGAVAVRDGLGLPRQRTTAAENHARTIRSPRS